MSTIMDSTGGLLVLFWGQKTVLIGDGGLQHRHRLRFSRSTDTDSDFRIAVSTENFPGKNGTTRIPDFFLDHFITHVAILLSWTFVQHISFGKSGQMYEKSNVVSPPWSIYDTVRGSAVMFFIS